MNEKRLRAARKCLTKTWLKQFGKGVYDKNQSRLYSDDRQWYLAKDDEEENLQGVCLYTAALNKQ